MPATGGARVLYVVADPADTISEVDENDNTASLMAFGPDLEIVAAGVDYWGGNEVGLRTLIRNVGTSPAPATTLAFYHEALTGTLAITDSAQTLAAGEVITMTTPWNFGGMTAGDYPMVAVVNQADFAETFTANNSDTFPLEVRPDLMVSPYYLWATPLGATTAAITATVFNIGPVEATDVTVGFYRSATFDAAALAFTRAISTLGPGATAQLSGQVDVTPGSDLYVLVDPDWELLEITHENNLASVTVHEPAQAAFSATPLSGVAPLQVAFTDQSSGDITDRLWDFGDGSSSILANPVHIFLTPGTYDVTLTVNGPGGVDTLTQMNYITVNEPPPMAAFAASPTSGFPPLAVQFFDQSSGIINARSWNFGDGGTSTAQNPAHTYAATGVYTVTLTVSGPGGSDQETKSGYINVGQKYDIYLPLILR